MQAGCPVFGLEYEIILDYFYHPTVMYAKPVAWLGLDDIVSSIVN